MSGDQRPPLDLRLALQIVRRRWLWIAVPIVLATALQLVLVSRATPLYQSSVEMLLRGKSTDALLSGVADPNAITANNFYSDRVLATEIRIIGSVLVYEAASKKLGFEASVSASGNAEAGILNITATDPDPKRAALVANAYAEVYRDFRRKQTQDEIDAATVQLSKKSREYGDQIGELTSRLAALELNGNAAQATGVSAQRDAAIRAKENFDNRIDALTVDASLKSGVATVLTPAYESSEPFSPQPVRSLLIGFVAGLFAGLSLAFLREFLDGRVRDSETLNLSHPSVPVLGLIPNSRRRFFGRSKLAPDVAVPAVTIESYRALRSAVRFLGVDHPIKVLEVTSPTPSDGKSTTAVNLARVMAHSGLSVLLVDADLRNPTLHDTFGIDNDEGLSTVLAGRVGIAVAARRLELEHDLTVLPSGPVPPNPAELLGSPRAEEFLAECSRFFDMVILDVPPVLAFTDPVVLAHHADGVLLVCRSGATKTDDVSAAIEVLAQSKAPLSGFVLNAVARSRRAMGGYDYGYSYGSAARRSRRKARRGKRAQVSAPLLGPLADSPIWTTTAADTPWTVPIRVAEPFTRASTNGNGNGTVRGWRAPLSGRAADPARNGSQAVIEPINGRDRTAVGESARSSG